MAGGVASRAWPESSFNVRKMGRREFLRSEEKKLAAFIEAAKVSKRRAD